MLLEIRRLHRELGVTMVFVTHDQSEAMTLSDRVAVFNQGRIEQLATPQALYDAPANPFVASFLGDNNMLNCTLADAGGAGVRTANGQLLQARISPSNLIIRMNNPSFTASQLHIVLVRAIRDEFDHNLSQQVYISSVAWDLLKNAKEETIKLINLAASGLPQGSDYTELATRILELNASIEKSPIAIAQEYIKSEIRTLF